MKLSLNRTSRLLVSAVFLGGALCLSPAAAASVTPVIDADTVTTGTT